MSEAKYLERYFLLWYKMYNQKPQYAFCRPMLFARNRFYKNLKYRKKFLTKF